MVKIGEICESGAITYKWRINDFSKLSDERNICYESPKFYFCGASWEIWIYPNGETEHDSDGWIGIYIIRNSNGFPLSLSYSVKLKTDDETIHSSASGTQVFQGKGSGWGKSKLISRSFLTERKTKFINLDALTVICTLKTYESQAVAGSLFCRQQDLCDNLKEIYAKAKRSDFLIKVNGEDIRTHRLILEARSAVFAAMINHDTKENQTGETAIDDMEKVSIEVILEYMYTGDIAVIRMENAFSIYAAADKYGIKDVKEMCAVFIKNNVSVEWVCDIIKFADLYHEEELEFCAREYFKKNSRKILRTKNWKTFAKKNVDMGVELLGSVVNTLKLK